MTQFHDWLGRDVLFFGGKGGGETTCATTCALLASEAGKRTLMVSTDLALAQGARGGLPREDQHLSKRFTST